MRRLALRRVKPYLTKYYCKYCLNNSNVSFSYNHINMSFSCINLKNKKEIFQINYENYKLQRSNNVLKRFLNEKFNQICAFYDANTTYEHIYLFLSENYNIEIQSEQKINESGYAKLNQTPQYVDDYNKDTPIKELININTASIEEISKLPGINFAMAKKIVIARGDIGGFESKEEFYNRYNIKPHFQKQLDEIIYFSIGKADINDNNDIQDIINNINSGSVQKNNDRIIDI